MPLYFSFRRFLTSALSHPVSVCYIYFNLCKLWMYIQICYHNKHCYFSEKITWFWCVHPHPLWCPILTIWSVNSALANYLMAFPAATSALHNWTEWVGCNLWLAQWTHSCISDWYEALDVSMWLLVIFDTLDLWTWAESRSSTADLWWRLGSIQKMAEIELSPSAKKS